MGKLSDRRLAYNTTNVLHCLFCWICLFLSIIIVFLSEI